MLALAIYVIDEGLEAEVKPASIVIMYAPASVKRLEAANERLGAVTTGSVISEEVPPLGFVTVNW